MLRGREITPRAEVCAWHTQSPGLDSWHLVPSWAPLNIVPMAPGTAGSPYPIKQKLLHGGVITGIEIKGRFSLTLV